MCCRFHHHLVKGENPNTSQQRRHTPFELHRLFGNRHLADFSVLSSLGSGLQVYDAQDVSPTIGDVTTVDQRRRGSSRRAARKKLELVGMDIGYGSGTSPGGYNYCLTLVDSATRMVFCYGLSRITGADLQDAFWRFLVDAGGVPSVIQCDFDPRFLGGTMARFLRSLRITVRSAPPRRQSSNGLVERTWRTGVRMARAFLAEAKLPRQFWFWALREAFHRMNLLPVRLPSSSSSSWSTPLHLFYDRPPDYRVLFPFGSLGYFHRPTDGARSRQTFESRSFVGIAVGRSDFCNGLIFYNPDLRSFSVSSDYVLDPDRSLADAFPALVYDGGIQLSLWARDNGQDKSIFPPGTPVYWRDTGSTMRNQGTVVQVPTTETATYRIQPTNPPSDTLVEIDRTNLWGVNELKQSKDVESSSPDNNVVSGDETAEVLRPAWLRDGEAVTLQCDDNGYVCGELRRDDYGEWQFVSRDKCRDNQRLIVSLPDLVHNYRDRMVDGTFIPGWTVSAQTVASGRFVSAKGLDHSKAPTTLLQLPKLTAKDRTVWTESYGEEHGSLRLMDVFDEIDTPTYEKYKAAGFVAIPTMNIFTIKPDEMGNPYRAKSRIVVLGNLEERVWTNSDRYAPVLQSTSCRLLISMAVEVGKVAKQGDCKNAFCQPELPDDKVVICAPPKGCPLSKPGTYWKLKKTLYGLRRSPRHWYEKFVSVLINDLGFVQCANDPCVLKCDPLSGEAPIYVGVYVDNFIYFSASDKVEEWFESTLRSRLTVDFMGPVSYFLGCRYQWYRTENGLAVHISQPGFVEQFLHKFNMHDCSPAKTPYRSGLPIDRVEPSGVEPDRNPRVAEYRSLMGGLTWLTISTRPDLAVAHKLLSRHITNPSAGHVDAAKHVLRYIRGTTEHRISFYQNQRDSTVRGFVSWPPQLPTPAHQGSCEFTDSNWGPQDASRPLPEGQEQRTVTADECKSLQGAMILRCGGPIWWKVEREERCSRSSCEAEIKSMDLAAKEGLHAVFIMRELGVKDAAHPIPLYNDNRGSVDWSGTGAITKRLRHLNMREVAIRDSIAHGELAVHHIPGKTNPADLLTKEHRDEHHFKLLRDHVVPPSPSVGGVGTDATSKRTNDELVARRTKDKETKPDTRAIRQPPKSVSWADIVKRRSRSDNMNVL